MIALWIILMIISAVTIFLARVVIKNEFEIHEYDQGKLIFFRLVLTAIVCVCDSLSHFSFFFRNSFEFSSK